MMHTPWRQCVLVGALGLTFTRGGHAAEPVPPSTPGVVPQAPQARPLGYIRPALGWGGAIVSDPGGQPSFYRAAFGLGAGASLHDWSIGLDFTYFWGSKFVGVDSLQNPTEKWEAKMNAFRLAADASYDVGFGWLVVRPHVLAGLEWRRATIAPDEVGVRRVPFMTPASTAR